VPYYLGIDGGGTKTTCAVGDESRLLATAISGPSNIVRAGEAQARESLERAVRQACAAVGISAVEVARTCIGAAGAAHPEVAEKVHQMLASLLLSPVEVVGDMQIALEAAFDNGPGVIVIAGTGSIAYGRDANGNTARAGGRGFAISDEGSAHWIGRAAVGAVLRAADLCAGTSENFSPPDATLAVALLQAGQPEQAIAHCRRALELRPDYAEARRVLEAALLAKRQKAEAGAKGPADLPAR